MSAPHRIRVTLRKSIWLLGSKGIRIGRVGVSVPNNFCKSHHFFDCSRHICRTQSSQRIIFPNIKPNGIVGKPTNRNRLSAFSMISRPCLWPIICITVIAPNVTADQYNDPTTIPLAAIGQTLFTTFSPLSIRYSTAPNSGYDMV